MAMDWNPIVSAGVGGLVGVLGSYATQRAQMARDIRKAREERGNEAALKVLDGVNEFHSDVRKAVAEEELNGYVPGWPDVYQESEQLGDLVSKLRVDVLLIPDSSTRKKAADVVDVLANSWFIGGREGVDGDRVALELSEYARDIIGRYLRGQRQRPTPARIRRFLRVEKSWSKEWDKKRRLDEKAKKKESEERRKSFEKGEIPSPPRPPADPPASKPDKTDPGDAPS